MTKKDYYQKDNDNLSYQNFRNNAESGEGGGIIGHFRKKLSIWVIINWPLSKTKL